MQYMSVRNEKLEKLEQWLSKWIMCILIRNKYDVDILVDTYPQSQRHVHVLIFDYTYSEKRLCSVCCCPQSSILAGTTLSICMSGSQHVRFWCISFFGKHQNHKSVVRICYHSYFL